MIEISLPFDSHKHEREIDQWCETHFGQPAKSVGHLCESRPWRPSLRFAHTVYQFVNERDAMLFTLKWL